MLVPLLMDLGMLTGGGGGGGPAVVTGYDNTARIIVMFALAASIFFVA